MINRNRDFTVVLDMDPPENNAGLEAITEKLVAADLTNATLSVFQGLVCLSFTERSKELDQALYQEVARVRKAGFKILFVDYSQAVDYTLISKA